MFKKQIHTQFVLSVMATVATLMALNARPAAAQEGRWGVDPLTAWCRDTVENLSIEEGRAFTAGRFYGPAEELAALKNGLVAAEANSFPGSTGPLTALAIRRGKFYIAALEAKLGQSEVAMRTISYFLHSYYGFIRHVANDIDIPFFIPRTFCDRCRPSIPDYAWEIERRNVQFASAELTLALHTMVTSQGGEVFPVGPAQNPSDGFLTVLSLSAGYVVEDLRASLMASPYACLIGRLRQIASEAASQSGPSNPEWNKVLAVRYLHSQATYFGRELSEPTRCPSRGYPPQWPSGGANNGGQWPSNDANGPNPYYGGPRW